MPRLAPGIACGLMPTVEDAITVGVSVTLMISMSGKLGVSVTVIVSVISRVDETVRLTGDPGLTWAPAIGFWLITSPNCTVLLGALVTLPMTIGSSHFVLSHPATLGRLTLVAVMAIVLGFACELQALRRLKPSTAGVLFALDPAVAFAIGLIVLSQSIHPWDLIGMVCVVVAGAGVTYDAANSKPTLVQ